MLRPGPWLSGSLLSISLWPCTFKVCLSNIPSWCVWRDALVACRLLAAFAKAVAVTFVMDARLQLTLHSYAQPLHKFLSLALSACAKLAPGHCKNLHLSNLLSCRHVGQCGPMCILCIWIVATIAHVGKQGCILRM